ncbi:hypothetical protein [Halegenticoccus tardaugens]|uniref:hypothetical protein n=1 Tax=Halegenticoccus tardaugens TaxID=2071624 RepID=UPI0013E97E17|nr:hypothetical protein [Halegenticoccus tardaugens]
MNPPSVARGLPKPDPSSSSDDVVRPKLNGLRDDEPLPDGGVDTLSISDSPATFA